MSESNDENPLFALYHRYIGDPDRAIDVYAGFGLFFAGVGLILAGVVTFLYSATLPQDELSTYAVREVAAVAGAIGLPALLASIVVLLPVDRRMLYVAGVGALVCVGATALFVWAYPYNWNVTSPPDYSAQGVAVYSVGIVLVIASTGAALVAHRVEQATEGVPSETEAEDEDETITDEQVRADIERELADAELTWGGVERTETRRLKLDTSAIDDIDRDSMAGTATETRTQSGTVNDAVSQLKGLQGGQAETASGQGVDDQASALRELRERQKESQSESRSLLDRIRNFVAALSGRRS